MDNYVNFISKHVKMHIDGRHIYVKGNILGDLKAFRAKIDETKSGF